MNRVITYVDGFNLYFGLKSKGWRKYYWIDLAKLSNSLLKENQTLAQCHYFTARIKSRRHGQNAKRQNIWLEAIESRENIKTHYGHYLVKKVRCLSCHTEWEKAEEKMTDVNIATQILVDAFSDNFDTAIVISGDSDLTTPIKEVIRLFPNKRIIVAFPPKRYSDQLKKASSGYLHIGEDKLKNSLLPQTITKEDGYVLTKPKEWQ